MEKKNRPNKLILVLLTVVFVTLTAYIIKNTMAIFEESVTTKAGERLAKWDITINNTTMGTNTNTFALSSLNWTASQRVKPGKVAPGMGGVFTINIDPGDTEVAIRYDITFDTSELTNTEFQITSVIETTDGNLVRTGENTYSNIITLADIALDKVHEIRVNLVWNNNDYNSDADTEWGMVLNNSVNIPITVNLSQYDGTQLVEYVEETPGGETPGGGE